MIKVSICTITYNHGLYIAQAIEGVLAQRGPDIEVEMVIGDDVSTDNTREIVADYARRYPKNIKPLFHEKNLGPNRNSLACLAECDGDFIAALEGDDYWTDHNKLRLQVAALEARPESAMCFHDAETFNSETGTIEWTFGDKFSHILPILGSPPQLYSQLDIVRHGWFIPTASMLFRASSLPRPMPAWFEGVYSGDYTLQLLSTKHGAAIYLPRLMSRYRSHTGGISKGTFTDKSMKKVLHEYPYFRILIQSDYQKEAGVVFDTKLQNTYFGLSVFYGHTNDRLLQVYYYFKAITVNRSIFSKQVARILSKLAGKS